MNILDRLRGLHRYTITSEGASPGYFRLVEDPKGAWVTWAEVEAIANELEITKPCRVCGAADHTAMQHGDLTRRPRPDTKTCPQCGHDMVHPEYIALPRSYGTWICPTNMPYQGCGLKIR